MAKLTPKFILKNCTIYTDRENRIGQAQEITIPDLDLTTEEFLNAGMVMKQQVVMGVLEAQSIEFKETAIDPDVIDLFGAPDKEYMVVGALRDADGGNQQDAVLYYRGEMNKLALGSWQPGEKAEADYTCTVDYMKFEINGQNIIELSPFSLKVRGEEVYGYSKSMING